MRHEDIQLVSAEEAMKQSALPTHKRIYGNIRLSRAWKSRRRKYGSLKGKYWRNIPVSSELYLLISELKAQDFGSDEYGKFLLPHFCEWERGNQAEILRGFCEEIGLPSVKFHTLRACFATHLISRGVPSVTVMKICGWKDLKTAERYIRYSGIDERGATEGLDFLPNDQGIMEKVVSLYDFRDRK